MGFAVTQKRETLFRPLKRLLPYFKNAGFGVVILPPWMVPFKELTIFM